MAQTQAIRPTFSATLPRAAATADVPRTESPAGSVLALLPAVYGLTLLAPVAGLAWNPIWYAFMGLAFYFAGVILAAIDEHRLRSLGVTGATAYWALLGALPYLVARTRALTNADRPGLGLLWVAIGSSLVTITGLALVALV